MTKAKRLYQFLLFASVLFFLSACSSTETPKKPENACTFSWTANRPNDVYPDNYFYVCDEIGRIYGVVRRTKLSTGEWDVSIKGADYGQILTKDQAIKQVERLAKSLNCNQDGCGN